ncbi:hypothetical protein [Amycolatopsis samaneae]|uniref:Uncharacterized protein n=1 Tax=Amycolatopsis samaneae TaxID=664691 RepID=A0ABW5GID2_9PSEU
MGKVERLFVAARAAVARNAANLAEAAVDASITWTPEDTAGDDGFYVWVSARIEQRQDDVRAVRDVLANSVWHRNDAPPSSMSTRRRRGKTDAAGARAAEEVTRSRAKATDRLSAWWSHYASELPDIHSGLQAVLDGVGEPDTLALPARFDELVRDQFEERRGNLHRLAGQRDQAEGELAELRDSRADIAAERDDAPTHFAARTASRMDRQSTRLWWLVPARSRCRARSSGGGRSCVGGAESPWEPARRGDSESGPRDHGRTPDPTLLEGLGTP